MIVRLDVAEPERRRIAEVERLRQRGDVERLASLLSDPSWAVRRAVVASLALLGQASIQPLCAVLRARGADEGRLAAAVDALVASFAEGVDDAVIALAGDSNHAVVCDAAQILGRRQCARAVPVLAGLARGSDENVVLAAFEALGRIGGATAIDLLIAAVESRSFFRTFPAIEVLGRTGDPRAVAPLVGLLSAAPYAIEAAKALGRSAQPSAIAPLVSVLTKANDARVRASAVALAELHDRYAQRFGPSRAVRDALRKADAAAASQGSIRALNGADPAERTALCRVLGWMGGAGAVRALVEVLDAEPPASAAAAAAIADLDGSAEPFLLEAVRESGSERRLLLLPILARRGSRAKEIIECLQDANPAVRAIACDSLGRMGDPAAVPALFEFLADADGRVSQASVAAIQSLGGSDTESLALAAARSDDPRRRRSALRILAYFGWASALEVFLSAMQDPDARLRDIAAVGLAALDDERAVGALLAAVVHESPRTRAAAARALGQSRRVPEVCRHLEAALADPDAWVRYYACQSLSRLRDERATDRIRSLLEDPAGHVRVAAIEALARLGGEQALNALHAAAQSADADLQRAALLGIGNVHDAASLPHVHRGLASTDAATRLVALSALAEFPDRAALSGLREALSDTDESVRGAAVTLLTAREGIGATEVLVSQLDNPVIRERVLAALAAPPSRGRLEGLVSALRVASSEKVPDIASALVRMRRPEAAAAVEDAFSTEDAGARRALGPALAALGTPSARKLLERAAVQDVDAQVRQICSALLVG